LIKEIKAGRLRSFFEALPLNNTLFLKIFWGCNNLILLQPAQKFEW